ncbi:MAG: TIGR03087 family PEP-CTERM/XrtA system glycosyltransferase [Geminicoccaceae bacterium]|nr:TIGR03087 family PEP-CTERM/XrtA system glycosyltransferase [Geminicoccaceae bacterium]
MARILFLAHRVPYPPDKGEKIRAYHMLRHLARRHEVHLGAFVDDPADLEPARYLETFCASVRLVPVGRLRRWASMAAGFMLDRPLSEAALPRGRMDRWVASRRPSVDLTIGCSAAVAPFVGDGSVIFDLVDCDSEKWRALATRRSGLLRFVFDREARLVRRLEQEIALRSEATLLVSAPEAALCRAIAPQAAETIHVVANGVDFQSFDVERRYADPYPEPGRPTLVFTGVMSYAPNIEAVCWFREKVWPALRRLHPDLRLAIVGSRPAREVRALADADVLVTGRVSDVRPYLAHATIAIAPLMLARGIQNKVLEAMAMRLPVVVSEAAGEGIEAEASRHLEVASDADAFCAAIDRLLKDEPARSRLGANARALVEERYAWPARLAKLDELVETALTRAVSHAAGTDAASPAGRPHRAIGPGARRARHCDSR